MNAWRLLVIAAAILAAYVIGRAAGILLGIGPYVTQAIAVAAVIAVLVWRSHRER